MCVCVCVWGVEEVTGLGPSPVTMQSLWVCVQSKHAGSSAQTKHAGSSAQTKLSIMAAACSTTHILRIDEAAARLEELSLCLSLPLSPSLPLSSPSLHCPSSLLSLPSPSFSPCSPPHPTTASSCPPTTTSTLHLFISNYSVHTPTLCIRDQYVLLH